MWFSSFIVTLGTIWINNVSANPKNDVHLKSPEMIHKYGYPAESHTVLTEDGYILTMHRIPYSPRSAAAPNKRAVFLQHGLIGTSADWLVLGPNMSIAYILADEGYDVWIGNSRGNAYSRKHQTLSSKDGKFWDYSFHELGVYDIAAEIDYILNTTKQKSLYCVAVSLGSTSVFTLVSARLEYNYKIRIIAAEAPFTMLRENSGSFITATTTIVFGKILNALGFKVITPIEWPQILLAETICSSRLTRFLCALLLYEFAGYDTEELDEDFLPTVVSHLSGGITVKTFLHAVQNMNSGKFQEYDYGSLNYARYHQPDPPIYNLSAISVPVALYYGQGDKVVLPEDVVWLNRTLGNPVGLHKIARSTFSHFGFLYGKHSKYLVNDRIVETLKKY